MATKKQPDTAMAVLMTIIITCVILFAIAILAPGFLCQLTGTCDIDTTVEME